MTSKSDRVRLAAQADLVFLTAEMLRPVQALPVSQGNAWWQLPMSDYKQLLDLAIGSDDATALSPSEFFFHVVEPENLPTLLRAFEDVYREAGDCDLDAWSDEHWRLFDGAQACPINQASYIRRDKGTILGDVAGFYAAFGWKSNPSNGERPDHLVTQLEFVAWLLAMAAQAEEIQERQVVQEALGEFAKLHMHDWIPSVSLQLLESTRLKYFGAVGQWLTTFWLNLALQHNWPVESVEQSIHIPSIDPEDPYECGAPDLVTLEMKQPS